MATGVVEAAEAAEVVEAVEVEAEAEEEAVLSLLLSGLEPGQVRGPIKLQLHSIAHNTRDIG